MPASSSTKDNVANHQVHSPRPPPSGSSVTSFADFVSAPGRGRRFRHGASQSVSGTPRSAFFPHAPSQLSKSKNTESAAGGAEDVDEVLFDSDETGTGTGASKSVTRTEESLSE
jgi:hypothetical protein